MSVSLVANQSYTAALNAVLPTGSHRFAGLAAYLEMHDITVGLSFPMVPDAKFEFFRMDPALIELNARAATVGVKLKIDRHYGQHPYDTVTGVKSADPARFISSAEIRSEFQASLEGAS